MNVRKKMMKKRQGLRKGGRGGGLGVEGTSWLKYNEVDGGRCSRGSARKDGLRDDMMGNVPMFN